MLGLITVKDRQFIKEYHEGGVVNLGRRRLVSPAQAGWTDGEHSLLEIAERPLTEGKERTGEAPIYIVRTDDIEKAWPEQDIPPPPPPPTDEERIDEAFPQTDVARVIFEAFFEISNRVMALEGKQPITRAQIRDWLKAKLP